MKKILSYLLCLTLIMGMAALPSRAYAAASTVEVDGVTLTVEEDADGSITIPVQSWSELEAAFSYSKWNDEAWTVRLEKDLSKDAGSVPRSSKAMMELNISGSNITFDLNGHTLTGTDNVSTTDLENYLSDFIRVNMAGYRGSTLHITDTAGGGGVKMISERAVDDQLAALHVKHSKKYYVPWADIWQSTSEIKNKLIIDGGSYSLDAKCKKFGNGTVSHNDPNWYRGCVIADWILTEINGGTFTANGQDIDSGKYNMCARELSAFATCCNFDVNSCSKDKTTAVINGGLFRSNGYAIHHFDHSYALGKTYHMQFPMINGGLFDGRVGFTGMTFTYSDGCKEYNSLPASDIINGDSLVVCSAGKTTKSLDDGLTLKDLHDCKSLMVLNDNVIDFETYPATDDEAEATELERDTDQKDTFRIRYRIPAVLAGALSVAPYITYTDAADNTETVYDQKAIIDYAGHVGEMTAEAGLNIACMGETITLSKKYRINVIESKKPAVITKQPQRSRVEPGETAELSVGADHAASYQWYYLYDGKNPYPLNEQFVSMLGVDMSGYDTDTLSYTSDVIGAESFYCMVTGTDGTAVKSDTAAMAFGGVPEVTYYGGGEYKNGGTVKFAVQAKYMDKIEYQIYPKNKVEQIKTLKEFAQEHELEYGVKMYKNAGLSVLTFKNVPDSFSEKYYVVFTLENAIGKVSNSDMINNRTGMMFELKSVPPSIIEPITGAECYVGGRLDYSFSAENMSGAEWRFEKSEEDGSEKVYGLDEMRGLFPDTGFIESVSEDGTAASLSITNAASGLSEYTLYAYAIGENAVSDAGSTVPNVHTPSGFEVTDCTENGRSVTLISPQDGSVALIAAGYDSAGRLSDAVYRKTDVTVGTNVCDMGRGVDGDTVKIMIWSGTDSMIPLCDIYTDGTEK